MKKKAKKTKKTKKTKKKAVSKPKPKKPVKKAAVRSKPAATKVAARKVAGRRPRGRSESGEVVEYQRKGLGARSAGQAGDIQGISSARNVGSESVEELLEEGQTLEAEAVAGVENAPDPDVSEVVTHQFPEDDVPEEYQDKD